MADPKLASHELIRQVCDLTGVPRRAVRAVVRALGVAAARELRRGVSVCLAPLGRLKVVDGVVSLIATPRLARAVRCDVELEPEEPIATPVLRCNASLIDTNRVVAVNGHDLPGRHDVYAVDGCLLLAKAASPVARCASTDYRAFYPIERYESLGATRVCRTSAGVVSWSDSSATSLSS